MALWFLLALMTGAAVLAVLVPLSVRHQPAGEPDTDIRFYRDQLAEIERDRGRGALGEAEAEAARTEAARRLLRANAAATGPSDTASEPALRRRRAASALALSVIPIVALAVYGALGSPHLASASRPALSEPDARMAEFNAALAKLEAHLASDPNDVRGWDLVAPIYLRTGRLDDAVKAFASARRAGGDTADRVMGFGEASVMRENGIVSAQARAAFARGVELDPGSARGRFYLALAAEQDGDKSAASESYRALIRGAPAGAPWVPMVQARLAGLGETAPKPPAAGAPAAEGPAAIDPQSVTPEMITAMVEGLDARVGQNGGTEAEWGRLVRSFAVLGRRDEAADRLGRARTALAGESGARERLDQLGRELGLGGDK